MLLPRCGEPGERHGEQAGLAWGDRGAFDLRSSNELPWPGYPGLKKESAGERPEAWILQLRSWPTNPSDTAPAPGAHRARSFSLPFKSEAKKFNVIVKTI